MSEQDLKILFEDPKHTVSTLEKLKKRNDEYYQFIYSLYQRDFIKQGRSLVAKLNDRDFEDAFQEAIIAFMKNLDKISDDKSISDYLFGIYKNKLYQRYRELCKFQITGEMELEIMNHWDEKTYKLFQQNHLEHIFRQALSQIGERCKTLLTLIFYRNFAAESVATNMGYSNNTVVHAKTWQCVKKIEKLIKDKL